MTLFRSLVVLTVINCGNCLKDLSIIISYLLEKNRNLWLSYVVVGAKTGMHVVMTPFRNSTMREV
jgi:hypothetical protein